MEHTGSRIRFVSRFFRFAPLPMLAIACALVTLPAFAQDTPRKPAANDKHTVLVNGETRAVLATDQGKEAVRGRVSGHLAFTPASLEKGVVVVNALNWVVFGVEQTAITGKKPEGKPTSALGFTVAPGELQGLKYDGKVLRGKLRGQLSMDQFFELTPPQDRGKDHDLDMRTLPAVMEIEIPLQRPLKRTDDGVETRKVDAKIVIRAKAYEPLGIRKDLTLEATASLRIEVDWVIMLEVAQRLCIQPVRIGAFRLAHKKGPFGISIPYLTLTYSGDGLNFGLPGAYTEWGKADIVFEVRDWMTIYNASYSTLTAGEKTALRNEVNEDDCVEVFFVDRFDPQDMDGGGNTISGGTESAKIISSDENADFGVDLTHLAHELGHALTLKHPGEGFPKPSAPHRIDGTSGTLMCPSGFNNDNPAVNSQDNKDNASNPLLKFAFKLRGPGVDCTDDADCGACP